MVGDDGIQVAYMKNRYKYDRVSPDVIINSKSTNAERGIHKLQKAIRQKYKANARWEKLRESHNNNIERKNRSLANAQKLGKAMVSGMKRRQKIAKGRWEKVRKHNEKRVQHENGTKVKAAVAAMKERRRQKQLKEFRRSGLPTYEMSKDCKTLASGNKGESLKL